jgi:hypothetical protein
LPSCGSERARNKRPCFCGCLEGEDVLEAADQSASNNSYLAVEKMGKVDKMKIVFLDFDGVGKMIVSLWREHVMREVK